MISLFDRFKRDFLYLLAFKIILIATLVFCYSYFKKEKTHQNERYPIFLNIKKG
ncbi:MAG: hypothetical protein HEEMFOPI_00449 [Holosporales bacterium]